MAKGKISNALAHAGAEESVAASRSKVEAAVAVIASEVASMAGHHQAARNLYAAEADAHDASRSEWERTERDMVANHQRAFDAMRSELQAANAALKGELESTRAQLTEANRKLRTILGTVS